MITRNHEPVIAANLHNWQEVVKDKSILFDTNVFITTQQFGAEQLFTELQLLNVKMWIPAPVRTELLNINSKIDREKRIRLLLKYQVNQLKLTSDITDSIDKIQEAYSELNCYPSVVDLYLASYMLRLNNGITLLMTSNIKDFPSPLFSREGYITLQNSKSVITFCLLKINKLSYS